MAAVLGKSNPVNQPKKPCTKCGVVKPISEYYTTNGRVQSWCGTCTLEYAKTWRAKNPERVAAGRTKWRKENPERQLRNSREYYRKNKDRLDEYRRNYAKANPEKELDWRLKGDFGIGLDEYMELLEKQGGICAICSRDDRKIVIDHDHLTGKIRGLLCIRCNVALGTFGDTAEGVERALNYLREHENNSG